jgi:1-acyl-sn-glycerol-3-phosphate acyltransferase
MLITIIPLPLQLLSKPFVSKKTYRRFAWFIAWSWARLSIYSTGSKVTLTGMEHVPTEGSICFVGNHQSLFDVPALLGWIGRPLGFIAKKELARIPVLSQWMLMLPSVLLDRDDPRQAMRAFKQAAQYIREGHPLVIFPEGGRSFTGIVQDFKPGALKLAQMANATIVPFAVDGTRKLLEIDKQVHSAHIKITLLPPVKPDDPLYRDKTGLPAHLKKIISDCLPDQQ